MENDTELNCLKAAPKKENTRVPTAAIGESNRLHNIFSASQEEQQPERHLCCISNISVTGGDLQAGQGCRHSFLPLPPPHLPALPDAGGGLVSWGLPAVQIPSHASPWPGGRQWAGSLSRWGCRTLRMAARRKRWTLSPSPFEQSCDEWISERKVQIGTQLNPNLMMFYEFKVNSDNESNLKLSSPSPRIAATTWSAPSCDLTGHFKQVEAQSSQHLKVFVSLKGSMIRTSLTGTWCIGTCRWKYRMRCSWQPLAQMDRPLWKKIVLLMWFPRKCALIESHHLHLSAWRSLPFPSWGKWSHLASGRASSLVVCAHRACAERHTQTFLHLGQLAPSTVY